MKRSILLLVCAILVMAVMLNGCGKKDDSQNVDQGETALSYNEAIDSGDYATAYDALLAGQEGTNPEDLSKFLVLPSTIECDDRDGKFTATFTYDDNGLLVKVDIPKQNSPELITFTYTNSGKIETKTVVKGKTAYIDSVTQYTYDSNGNLIKDYTEYNSNRKVYIDYTYNELGQVVTETNTTHSGYPSEPEPTILVYHSTYDENGNLLSRMNHDNTYGKVYTYDHNNNLLTECEVSSDGESNKHTYTYDENSRLIKERYDAISDPDWFTETHYAYDSNGTRYKTLYSDKGDEEAYTYENTFDENGRITSYTYTERDDNEYRVYTFDNAGNIIKAVNHKNGVENYSYTYAYDKYGNRTFERYESGNNHYEYSATYSVKYYPDGTPVISDFINELNNASGFHNFF